MSRVIRNRLQPLHKTTRYSGGYGIAIVYLADQEGFNKDQQGMLKKGMPYAEDLWECCEASFDGRDDVTLHLGVGIDIDAQIMNGANRQHRGVVYMDSSGWDEMLMSKRRTPEHFGLRGVEQQLVSPHPR